jgi:transmembrane sensor
MQITEEIIERFLANRCTPEEAEFVAAYLETHPELARQYLQESWDGSGQMEGLPAGYADEMLKAVLCEIKTKKKFSTVAFKWIGIAASLLILVGFAWARQSNQSPLADQAAAWSMAYSTPPEWKFIENNRRSPISEVLPDGSVVILSPKASLRYAASFAPGRRDLFLSGEALFEVTKDKTRPFTVHEGRFSITALGTIFRMKENQGKYKVSLYEGKVVIKANEVQGWKGDVFLEAGQQMEFNTGNQSLAVNHFITEKARGQKNLAKHSYAELEFVNRPLDQVLDKLAEQYKLSIEYNKPEIEHLYFSGKVLKTDSLETILKVIAQMNELKIAQKGNGFVVNKTQ